LKGNKVTEQSFAGKWEFLYIGFAQCPDICLSEMDMVPQTHLKGVKDIVLGKMRIMV